ncbi:hypothetical protein Y032_0406g891 [Ancylostoma ceylanicum]|uniref:Uncharacterized protein n=1 Tax=Ancylostoma ceylanicum TaxID=53326 RepID=A0A016X2K6_9BILA|nr:hypothetical protein Y032_0406g891 [Ancylostoma ceylanicum]
MCPISALDAQAFCSKIHQIAKSKGLRSGEFHGQTPFVQEFGRTRVKRTMVTYQEGSPPPALPGWYDGGKAIRLPVT